MHLGLRIQLGHEGDSCPVPRPSEAPFVVLHTNGIHQLSLDECGCAQGLGILRHTQLLRIGWWLATSEEPRTACSEELLESFHQLTLQSKVNAYDYYWHLSRRTNNVNNAAVDVCLLFIRFHPSFCSPWLLLSSSAIVLVRTVFKMYSPI